MCGIAGIISPYPEDREKIQVMTDMLFYRGPDARGFYINNKICLGHRRLSIIDLSENANQPIKNEDGSIQLVCNGEIYNYKELINDLEARGHVFASRNDNEVLVHLYEEFGDSFLEKVNGMFAFAIWDTRNNRMVAGVDRFGKKPLYFTKVKDRLIFSSELKSLLVFDWVKRDIDPSALDQYLTFRYVPPPLTIFKSVKKMSRASLMIWEGERLTFKKYWHPVSRPQKNYNEDSVNKFEDLFSDAVKIRLQSDVPLGVYLSGGVDSAAVASVMQRFLTGTKKSYTVSFDYLYDEFPRAKKVAEHLNFQYHSVTVSENDFNLMPKLAYHMDEPIGDLVGLPAYLLANKAKDELTVLLTGDGADEILNGYFHHKIMVLRERLNNGLKFSGARSFLSGMAKVTPSAILNQIFDYPERFGPREKVKLCQALASCGSFGSFYENIVSCFTSEDKESLLSHEYKKKLQGYSIGDRFQENIEKSSDFSFQSRLTLLELDFWIPFSTIFRLDKMNMAQGVETRCPFLDYRVVEMALNLPDEGKLNTKRNKDILRRLIEKLLPSDLQEKGKQAFYMPLTEQYKERFYHWLNEMVNPSSIKERGFFEWSYVQGLFRMSKSGSMLATRQLVALAMLEQWAKVFLNKKFPLEKLP